MSFEGSSLGQDRGIIAGFVFHELHYDAPKDGTSTCSTANYGILASEVSLHQLILSILWGVFTVCLGSLLVSANQDGGLLRFVKRKH